jgi:hypothetical protein
MVTGFDKFQGWFASSFRLLSHVLLPIHMIIYAQTFASVQMFVLLYIFD